MPKPCDECAIPMPKSVSQVGIEPYITPPTAHTSPESIGRLFEIKMSVYTTMPEPLKLD
jgi:hypothetical protein